MSNFQQKTTHHSLRRQEKHKDKARVKARLKHNKFFEIKELLRVIMEKKKRR